ncbi:MAG: diphosphomevalonate decarboxylase [Pseudomonadota bacterium]
MPAVSAIAGANIALVKYWGKRSVVGNLPAVGSLSITLAGLTTRTRVTPDDQLEADQLLLNGREDEKQRARVSATLARVRALGGGEALPFARVDSHNDFPTGAGLASSASGFAALVFAAAHAYEAPADASQLSALAREGSGSAARSIFGGFVEMARGVREDGSDAVATPLLEAADWPLEVVVAITASGEKDVGSTEGMNLTADTSAYWSGWLSAQEQDLSEARQAVLSRDFDKLAEVSELSCLKMHGLAMSARPGLLYWNGATVECIHRIRELRRKQALAVFFTVDAGPQVKAVCAPAHVQRVREALESVDGVQRVIHTPLGPGAHLVADETP